MPRIEAMTGRTPARNTQGPLPPGGLSRFRGFRAYAGPPRRGVRLLSMKTPARVGLAGAFIVVPVALVAYGATACEELACIGPVFTAALSALLFSPLLVWWLRSQRKSPLFALACGELASAYATLRRDFDFSPMFTLPAIVAGIVIGYVIGRAAERAPGDTAD